jgi:hypothetical protein
VERNRLTVGAVYSRSQQKENAGQLVGLSVTISRPISSTSELLNFI